MNFNSATLKAAIEQDLGPTGEFFCSDMSLYEVTAISLKRSILKKYVPKSRSKVLKQLTIDDFRLSNQKCKDVLLQFGGYDSYMYDFWRANCFSAFHGPLQAPLLDWTSIVQSGMYGPGASVGMRATHFFEKFAKAPLSTTSERLRSIYTTLISATWRDAESFRDSQYGHKIVCGSKLSTVQKSEKRMRTICTEPSLNLFLQKGIGTLLERPLKLRHNIDLSTQETVNKRLAWAGSCDDSYATIDLSKASDSISLRLAKRLIPENQYGYFVETRSPFTTIGDEVCQLYMLSSMGNGFTFSFMTLIFAELVVAAYHLLGITPINSGPARNYGVYGDDIICDKKAYHVVTRMLELSGFEVNSEKSYHTGYFRESCGGDFWKGNPVRGVYIQEVRHEQDFYSIINRLLRWSAIHGILLPQTLSYLGSLCRLRPVPFDVGDTAGIKIPFALLNNPKFSPNDPGSVLFRQWVPVLKVRQVEDDQVSPSALAICFVGGYLRTGRQGLVMQEEDPELRYGPRQRIVTYKIIRSETSSWDWNPYVGFTTQAYFRVCYLFLLSKQAQ